MYLNTFTGIWHCPLKVSTYYVICIWRSHVLLLLDWLSASAVAPGSAQVCHCFHDRAHFSRVNNIDLNIHFGWNLATTMSIQPKKLILNKNGLNWFTLFKLEYVWIIVLCISSNALSLFNVKFACYYPQLVIWEMPALGQME